MTFRLRPSSFICSQYLSCWRLQGGVDFNNLFTDRSDASGTGYFSSVTNQYRKDLLAIALKDDREIHLPKIATFDQFAGHTKSGIPIAAGAGDNAAAGLGRCISRSSFKAIANKSFRY